jgi:hypothetical protein
VTAKILLSTILCVFSRCFWGVLLPSGGSISGGEQAGGRLGLLHLALEGPVLHGDHLTGDTIAGLALLAVWLPRLRVNLCYHRICFRTFGGAGWDSNIYIFLCPKNPPKVVIFKVNVHPLKLVWERFAFIDILLDI